MYCIHMTRELLLQHFVVGGRDVQMLGALSSVKNLFLSLIIWYTGKIGMEKNKLTQGFLLYTSK